MANTSAICSSFKQELLQGKHSFESSGGHTFKIALYTSSATLSASTTAYSSSNEVSNSGTYTAVNGEIITWSTVTSGDNAGVTVTVQEPDGTTTNYTLPYQDNQ